ncbi:hypothetical protein KKG51_03170, partial [Patescibacteria group bacterium]|nr:hypothetical protein [Patescibacteria group bacterium]
MTKDTELLSSLFRELETELGTTDIAIVALKALLKSVKSLDFDTVQEFCDQFKNLHEVVTNTEPKFGILNLYFSKLNKLLSEYLIKNSVTRNRSRRVIIKHIKEMIKEVNLWEKAILKHAESLDVEGKTILIHDHSHTVYNVLAHYKYLGKNFRVIIAEQDFEKTHINIERMHKCQIPFQVVPAYMLSHVHNKVDMVFFGALTLKDTMNFVMGPGSHGLISEFNTENIPSYMFINTAKFSLWKSTKKAEIFIH